MNRRAESRRGRFIDGIVFVVLLAAVSAVTLTLFYRQTTGNPFSYHSDMKAYILEMQGLDSGYSFPYPIFFKLSALIHLFAGPEMSVAIATMLLNSLAIVVTKLAFNYLLLPDLAVSFQRIGKRAATEKSEMGRDATAGEGKGGKPAFAGRRSSRQDGMGWLAGIVISLAVVSLFFISMLYPPKGIYLPGIKFIYLGVFTANPFHNATFMAARPFAILAFLWYVKLLPVYERGITKRGEVKDYILFSLFLLLATMTKPSFTLILVSTAGLVMLYRLIKSRFRIFLPTIQLGICFLPTFIDLLYQYQGVFVPGNGGEGGVGFCFGEVWALYCDNIPLAVCLAVGFPLSVLVLNRKECRKNTLFAFSLQLYLVSFAEAFFLYEKGFRKVDFNFSWGYMYGIFFFHFGALAMLLTMTAKRLAGKMGVNTDVAAVFAKVSSASDSKIAQKVSTILLVLQWLAYFVHVVCGLFYFGVFMSGEMYY